MVRRIGFCGSVWSKVANDKDDDGNEDDKNNTNNNNVEISRTDQF